MFVKLRQGSGTYRQGIGLVSLFGIIFYSGRAEGPSQTLLPPILCPIKHTKYLPVNLDVSVF